MEFVRNNNCFIVSFQQLEATQKGLLPVQNTILALVQLITRLPEANKAESLEVLKELRKADVSMRERLFVLQVWRKYDQDTADKLSRRKAGEFLDPELAKVLEERDKKLDREKREREREKEKFRNQPKRFKGGAFHFGDFAPGSFDNTGYQAPSRGGYGTRGRGGSVRGGKRPGPDNKCHLCGSPDHFFKSCPSKK